MDEDPRPPRRRDLAKGPGEPVAVGDVHAHPGDVRVDGGPGVVLGAAGDREDAMVGLELLEEVPADEAGGAGEDDGVARGGR
jgi:hypothetical protein